MLSTSELRDSLELETNPIVLTVLGLLFLCDVSSSIGWDGVKEKPLKETAQTLPKVAGSDQATAQGFADLLGWTTLTGHHSPSAEGLAARGEKRGGDGAQATMLTARCSPRKHPSVPPGESEPL